MGFGLCCQTALDSAVSTDSDSDCYEQPGPGRPLEKYLQFLHDMPDARQLLIIDAVSASQSLSDSLQTLALFMAAHLIDKRLNVIQVKRPPDFVLPDSQTDSHGDAWYCDASGTRSSWAQGLHIWVPGLDSSLWCQRWRGGGNVPGVWPYWQHWTARHP